MANMIEKKFKNPELGIEFESYIDQECCVWFKAKEVAQILGYQKSRNAVEKHFSKKIYKRRPQFRAPLEENKNVY